MKRLLYVFCLSALLVSCGSKKKIVTKKTPRKVAVVKKPKAVTTKETPSTKETTPKEAPVVVPNSTVAYIEMYKDIAIEEMKTSGIPASITLAQGILESGSGKGRLAVKANNHFGIKCHDWKGPRIYHDDDKAQECFRKYTNAAYSFKDHSEFLTKRKRYAKLFTLKQSDYKGWARELRRAGYATDKKYPQKLIALIERYDLNKYDKLGAGAQVSVVEKIPENATRAQHVVEKGDTLYSISKKYNLTVAALQEINGLKSTALRIGQVLYLSK
jgi:flagellum-specific peptidoglycan hydrolase FlgJ